MMVAGKGREGPFVDGASSGGFTRDVVRCAWILGLTGLLLAGGCAGNREPAGGEAGALGDGTNTVRYPLVKPVLKLPGRVLTVNAKLRFAVLDFGFNPVPPDQSLLDVVRAGKVVGELRVNGPTGGSLIVADLVHGEFAPDDEVRPR